MKNFLMIACLAVCTALVSTSTSYAVVGGGGGGGKVASSARVAVQNSEPVAGGAGIAVWIRTTGTRVPATVDALRDELIFLGPGESRNTNNLRNGNYLITSVDIESLNLIPGDTPINQAAIDANDITTSSFSIEGVDRSLVVNSNTIDFLN